MAYMNQDKKAKIKAALVPIMKEYGLSFGLSVRDGRTIVCTIKSGTIDFIKNYKERLSHSARTMHDQVDVKCLDVNQYWYKDHFTGVALEAIGKILGALNIDNYDNSDSMTDYFDVGHYVDLNVGTWERPYNLITLGDKSLGDFRDVVEA